MEFAQIELVLQLCDTNHMVQCVATGPVAKRACAEPARGHAACRQQGKRPSTQSSGIAAKDAQHGRSELWYHSDDDAELVAMAAEGFEVDAPPSVEAAAGCQRR